MRIIKKAVFIDINISERYSESLEGIIAESRKNNQKIPMEDASNLKQAGKLK